MKFTVRLKIALIALFFVLFSYGFTLVWPDGTYCAEVVYFNPKIGKTSTYPSLKVEVEDNDVVKIYWPNGGWTDRDHFSGAELDDDGYTTFTTDKDYYFEVTLEEEC